MGPRRLFAPERLLENVLHDLAVDIGETKVTALETVRALGVGDAEQGQHFSVQVVDSEHVLDGVVAEFARRPLAVSALDSAARHPHQEALDAKVAA